MKTSLVRSPVVALGVLLAAVALGGGDCVQQTITRCEADEDCADPFKRCEVESGFCACITDEGCDPSEFCNAIGRCQVRQGCLSNDDCNQVDGDTCASQYCNTKSGQCQGNCDCDPEQGELCCSLDSHCPYGNICAQLDGRCVPGCRGDGDCRLGEGCVGAGLGGSVGQCAAGVCTGNNLCGFGESCNLESGECVFDTRGPYCAGCTGGVASDDCGEPANYCLTDTTDVTGAEFCGVDCSQQQPCPFGYSCNDVIIVPPSAPFCSAPETCVKQEGQTEGSCSRETSVTCTVDEDCPEGPPGNDCPRGKVGNCLLEQTRECSNDSECCDDAANCPPGSCVKQECRGREGGAFGACTCTRDLDCPRDQCKDADLSDPSDPQHGYCELSGHRCYDDLDCDVIACVDGGCRIGANCAPANDRSCRELGVRQ